VLILCQQIESFLDYDNFIGVHPEKVET
jgi:hypothetical protein